MSKKLPKPWTDFQLRAFPSRNTSRSRASYPFGYHNALPQPAQKTTWTGTERQNMANY